MINILNSSRVICSNVNINGQVIKMQGKSLSINNGKIYVDDTEMGNIEQTWSSININIEGGITGDVKVNGDLSIEGSVKGNINTCGDSIFHSNVEGNVTSSGDVRIHQHNGDIKCSGDVVIKSKIQN
jgi:cytoskeletal protein CcmA (bactofilin family)